jgi:hypothetical protein
VIRKLETNIRSGRYDEEGGENVTANEITKHGGN